jgi:hypothetical protein
VRVLGETIRRVSVFSHQVVDPQTQTETLMLQYRTMIISPCNGPKTQFEVLFFFPSRKYNNATLLHMLPRSNVVRALPRQNNNKGGEVESSIQHPGYGHTTKINNKNL